MHTHGGDVYRHKNVIDFSTNCNPFGTPESVKRAIAGAMNEIANYPDVHCEKLRCALSSYEGMPMEYIICGNGAADLIFSLVLALKPKNALLLAPTFAEYEQALNTVECNCTRYYLNEEKSFKPNMEILEKITDDIDMVFICNPNNPTGVLAEQKLIDKILDRCKEINAILILDECFVDFLDEPEKNTMKERLNDYPNLIILKAFTKRYAMAGVRLGYAICSNQKIMDRMKAVSQPWAVSILAQEAGIAALKEEGYVKSSMENLRKERKYLLEKISAMGFTTYDSKANYIFFKGPEDLYEFCLNKGILIRDCSNYEGLQVGYYRVAVKRREDNVKLIETLKLRNFNGNFK